jgi:hypothetical protein
VDWEPDSPSAPDHAPEPLQEVASVLDQVSVVEAPLAIDVEAAENVT